MRESAIHIALLFAASEERSGGPADRLPQLFGVSEAELISRLRANDESAYTMIYDAYRPRLLAIASAYVSTAVAEELVQDLLALVWERRAEWTVERGIGIYLYASVRNRALKQLRHEGVIGRLEHSAPAYDAPPGMGAANERADVQLERDAERDAVRAAVDGALARLSEGARTAFLLRWMHELSYPEIAQIMATSEATVRQQVAKARRAVVPVLERLAQQANA